MTALDRLKSACAGRCGDIGEPPCFDVVFDAPSMGIWTPCADCLADCGLEQDPEPIDPNAAIGDLFFDEDEVKG